MIPRTFTGTITKTQLWSRKAMSSLWEQRDSLLAADEIKKIDKLYKGKKSSGINQSQIITYKTSPISQAGRKGYGRLYGYGGYSLEQVPSDIRATLCHDIYHDLDIANCQPTILLKMAEDYGKALPNLSLYVANREEKLEELMAETGCSRAEAKQKFLAVLYGSGLQETYFLKALSHEVRSFAKALRGTDDWIELYNLTPSDNRDGSFLALVLQTEERRCLMAMNDYMEANGWTVGVLAYDGFMVQHRDEAPITDELLASISEAVREATGYSVVITEKPMEGMTLQESTSLDYAEEYKRMKDEFEKRFFYYYPTNTIVDTQGGLLHLSQEHALTALNTYVLPAEGKEEPLFIKAWIKDPARRIIRNLVYKLPEHCSDSEASLFTGFAFREYDGQDDAAVPLFMDLLRTCVGDEEPAAEYLLRYFAHIIQRPFEIPGTAVIFTSSTHGTGKDTLVGIMRKIIGRHAAHYTSETHFWDNHDTGKEGAILIHLEEACARANKAKAGALKALITADTISINPKGVKGYSVPNVARIIMTTNEADPVKLEESDRRFLICNPSDRLHARGADFWNSIQPQINSKEFLHTIGRHLESIDLTGWNPRMMPMTAEKEELLEDSKEVEQEFLEWLVEEYEGDRRCLTPNDMYREYNIWFATQHMDMKFKRFSPMSLAKAVRRYNGRYFKKVRTSKNRVYQLNERPPAAF